MAVHPESVVAVVHGADGLDFIILGMIFHSGNVEPVVVPRYVAGSRMGGRNYVHGYTEREAERLSDQAEILTGFLHEDTRYPAGSRVLEAGCGTGAQTVILARGSPEARVTSVDTSKISLDTAKKRVQVEGITNVIFEIGDIFDLPYEPEVLITSSSASSLSIL